MLDFETVKTCAPFYAFGDFVMEPTDSTPPTMRKRHELSLKEKRALVDEGNVGMKTAELFAPKCAGFSKARRNPSMGDRKREHGTEEEAGWQSS